MKNKQINYQEILEQLLLSPINFTEDNFFHGTGKKIYDTLRVFSGGDLIKVSDGAYVTGAYKSVDIGQNTGRIWLNSDVEAGTAEYIDKSDFLIEKKQRGRGNIGDRTKGFVPVFPYSLIKDICIERESIGSKTGIFQITLPIDELGTICSREEQKTLNSLLKTNQLTKADEYPLDSIKPSLCGGYDIPFKLRRCPIYMTSDGKKYIKLVAHSYNGNPIEKYTKTGTEYYQDGEEIWLTITNPQIYYNPTTNYAMYSRMVISGIRFQDLEEYKREHWLPRFAHQIAIAKIRQIMNEIPCPITEIEIKTHGEDYLKILLNTCGEDIQLAKKYIKLTFPPKIAKLLLKKLSTLTNENSKKEQKVRQRKPQTPTT